MIRLGRAEDGRLILGSNEAFPADIKYVEYYREQKLFNLVFDSEDEASALMPCEISDKTAAVVQSSPNIVVIALVTGNAEPYGYSVPLIQIGV